MSRYDIISMCYREGLKGSVSLIHIWLWVFVYNPHVHVHACEVSSFKNVMGGDWVIFQLSKC